MTDTTSQTGALIDRDEAVDAEFVSLPAGATEPVRQAVRSIDDTSPRHPVRHGASHGEDGLRLFVNAPATSGAAGLPAGPGFWLAGATLVFLAFWFAGGHAAVSTLSGHGYTATVPAGKTSLSLGQITSRVESHASGRVLFIDGRIENAGHSPEAVPDLNIDVATRETTEPMRYRLHHGQILQAGGGFAFSMRLAAPQGDVTSVDVTFAENGRVVRQRL
ncbi:MAG TPA: hypothetical protein PKE65_01675 [Rhizobiaceae bacterium]|nr:hypothetical protein [Rhizobiaceae bacterium]